MTAFRDPEDQERRATLADASYAIEKAHAAAPDAPPPAGFLITRAQRRALLVWHTGPGDPYQETLERTRTLYGVPVTLAAETLPTLPGLVDLR